MKISKKIKGKLSRHNLRFNGPYGPYGGLCDINFLGTENVFPLVILHKHIGPRIKRIKTFLFKRNNSFYVKFEVKTPQRLNRFSLLFSPNPTESKLTQKKTSRSPDLCTGKYCILKSLLTRD